MSTVTQDFKYLGVTNCVLNVCSLFQVSGRECKKRERLNARVLVEWSGRCMERCCRVESFYVVQL